MNTSSTMWEIIHIKQVLKTTIDYITIVSFCRSTQQGEMNRLLLMVSPKSSGTIESMNKYPGIAILNQAMKEILTEV